MAYTHMILGSNLGDRLGYIEQAKIQLNKIAGTIERHSYIYETEPWGFVHENFFLNQVVVIQTSVEPMALLMKIKDIETSMGRILNTERYTGRNIDIDILFYDNQVIKTKELVIPHPEIPNRRFVLEPLAEIDPLLLHPVLFMTCAQLLFICEDRCQVWKFGESA